jgi:hypothetical protein
MIEELGLADYSLIASPLVEDCIREIVTAAEAGAVYFGMSVHFADSERFMREWGKQ